MAKPADTPEEAFHPVAQDFGPNLGPTTGAGVLVGPEVLRPSVPPPPRPPWAVPAAPPIVVVIPRPTPKPVAKPTAKPTAKPIARPRVVAAMPSVADARAYALSRIGSTQYACLDRLFTRESNWNPHSYNSSSGAYGIPQAMPGDKMATFGADWRDNPITQVKWGLSYIAGRYGTACNAWAHSQTYGWY